jgi:hypothetical protein
MQLGENRNERRCESELARRHERRARRVAQHRLHLFPRRARADIEVLETGLQLDATTGSHHQLIVRRGQRAERAAIAEAVA